MDEEGVMYSKSDNIEVMVNDEADENITELIDSLKNRYQKKKKWNQWKVVSFSSITFIYFIVNVIKNKPELW